MKILYLTKGDHVDYQDDCLFIGLRELFGSDVVDYNKREHNYESFPEEKIKQFWGKGMTVSKVLDDVEVDRTEITKKIKNKYFDLIVYGSIWRCKDYIEDILKYYSRDEVVAVDGEDHQQIHKVFDLGIPYFKRELTLDNSRIFPIHFAVPTCKVDFNSNKVKNYSFITPFDQKTYIYDNEEDYYNDYREARFGVTTKKAGWDCMRHYEIMANNCIPYFVHLEHCPRNTLTRFPKQLCKQVNKDLLNDTPTNVYEKHINGFQNYVVDNNTTLALAKYFIETVKKI